MTLELEALATNGAPHWTSDSLIARDHEVVSPAIYRYTDIAFARGEGVFLYDFEGRRYYDMAAGIATMNVGHCHPRVVKAIADQAQTLIHAAAHVGYMAPYVEMAETLRSLMPPPLNTGKVLLVNSGSEAVETALKLARVATKRSTVLAFIDGFHGRPMGALAATGSNSGYRRHLAGLLAGVEHVPYPNCSRCAFGHGPRTPQTCCGQWKAFIQLTLEKLVHPDDLAAILVEPIAGEGGYIVPPDDFLPTLREICDRTGALLIVDEVQTGLGRTGRWFAFEHSGIVPDIVALGKAIGGGLPLGGIVARAEIMNRWWPGAHGSTFGGNPIACRAGLETIAILREEQLLENAVRVGRRLMQGFEAARASLPMIGEVRGKGLMIAVDLVDEHNQPLSAERVKQVIKALAKHGVVMTKCGPSALRLAPALILTERQADEVVDLVTEALRTL
ncbi:MAG: aspartate aminotransferase family protein [Anaerolineae bacterium]|nr:aspartate aminotransferase family protein [Thermoflexales bacterium]MDW8054484.1 aspartate aminotransferase family protein [Anaerolineae bacterium]